MSDPTPLLDPASCLFPLMPGSLVPITAVVLTVAAVTAGRSALDIAQPLPVGDMREQPRWMLQWSAALGLGILFYYAVLGACGWLLPVPDRLGPVLRVAFGFCGALLLGRAVLRLELQFRRPDAEDHAFDRPLALPDESLGMEEIAETAPAADPESGPRRPVWTEMPGLIAGLLMVVAFLAGWNTASLCLLKAGELGL